MAKHFRFIFLYCLAIAITSEAVTSSKESQKRPSRFKFSHGQPFYYRGKGQGQGRRHESAAPDLLDSVEELYFTQKVDHFSPRDHRTFQQRYLISRAYYKRGGPVFVIVDGGSGSLAKQLIGNWFHNTLAEKWGGLLLLIERRYYGNSQPTEDASTENLKYLTAPQNLADLEAFVAGMKELYNLENHKWVVYGAGLGGTLAAWLRIQNPDCVDAAVASSAPVKLEVDFKEYFEVVIDSLFAKYSQSCVHETRKAVGQIWELVDGGDHDWRKLIRIFDFCEPLDKTELNIQNMYSDLAQTTVASVVQYDENYIKPNVTGQANINIADYCEIMTDNSGRSSPIERYAQALKFVNAAYGVADGCYDVSYPNFIKYLTEDQWSSDSVTSAYRQYVYQGCTGFGWFQTSTWDRKNIFGDFPLDYFYQQCEDVFGLSSREVERSVQATNDYFGGVEGTKGGTSIIFTNGKIDPWHAYGVLNEYETNDANTVLFIPDTSNSADMYKRSSKDSIPLAYALNQIEYKLYEYLGLGSGDSSGQGGQGQGHGHTLKDTEPTEP